MLPPEWIHQPEWIKIANINFLITIRIENKYSFLKTYLTICSSLGFAFILEITMIKLSSIVQRETRA